jgi:hypothetical protein
MQKIFAVWRRLFEEKILCFCIEDYRLKNVFLRFLRFDAEENASAF